MYEDRTLHMSQGEKALVEINYQEGESPLAMDECRRMRVSVGDEMAIQIEILDGSAESIKNLSIHLTRKAAEWLAHVIYDMPDRAKEFAEE